MTRLVCLVCILCASTLFSLMTAFADDSNPAKPNWKPGPIGSYTYTDALAYWNAQGEVVVASDFSNTSPAIFPKYISEKESYDVNNGVFRYERHINDSRFAGVDVPNIKLKNFLLHVTVNFEDGIQETIPSFVILTRKQQWDTGYDIAGHSPATVGPANLHLFIRTNGVWQPTVEGTKKVWTPKSPFNLVIRCQGDSIKVWANETLALDVTNTAVRDAGSIALGVGAAATVTYDNLLIADLDKPSYKSTTVNNLPAYVLHRGVPYADANYLAQTYGWKCTYKPGTLSPITLTRGNRTVVINPDPLSLNPLTDVLSLVTEVGGQPYLPVLQIAKIINADAKWDGMRQTLTSTVSPTVQPQRIFINQIASDLRVQIYKFISETNTWDDVTQEIGPWQGKHIAFLVHGFPILSQWNNRASFSKLAAHLRNGIQDDQQQVLFKYDAVYTIEYPLDNPLNETGATVAKIITDHCPPGVKLDIFAHSMGGLVARSAIEGSFPISRKTAEQSVAHLVTLGTPHLGHPWAGDRNGPWFKISTTVAKTATPEMTQSEFFDEVLDMQTGDPAKNNAGCSRFLSELNNGQQTQVPYYSIYGTEPNKPTPYQNKSTGPSTLAKLYFFDNKYPRWNVNDGFMPVGSADYNLTSECKSWEDSSVGVNHDALILDPSVFSILDKWMIADKWFGNEESSTLLSAPDGILTTAPNTNPPIAVVEVGGKWGAISPTGQFVIKPQFMLMKGFSEGLAAACIGGKKIENESEGSWVEGGKWGFVDQTGNWVIKPQFDEARSFSEKFAPIKVGNIWGYINRKGQSVIKPTFSSAFEFQNGKAMVFINDTDSAMINTAGEILTGISGYVFSEGIAVKEYNEKFGYINSEGAFVISPKYDRAENFINGLACVSIGEKVGYIDRKENAVIPIKYPYVGSLSENLIAVNSGGRVEYGDFIHVLGGEWSYFDKAGKRVFSLPATLKPRNDEEIFAYDFSDGRAVISDEQRKCSVIDAHGNIIVQHKFDSISDYLNGFAIISLDGKYGYIDVNGKIIIKPKYSAAGSFSR